MKIRDFFIYYNENRLVMISSFRNIVGLDHEIIGVEEGNLENGTTIMPLEYLGPFPEEFAFNFYSTTFDPCQSKYYLTIAEPGTTVPFPGATTVSTLDLISRIQSNFLQPGFYYGLEYNRK